MAYTQKKAYKMTKKKPKTKTTDCLIRIKKSQNYMMYIEIICRKLYMFNVILVLLPTALWSLFFYSELNLLPVWRSGCFPSVHVGFLMDSVFLNKKKML